MAFESQVRVAGFFVMSRIITVHIRNYVFGLGLTLSLTHNFAYIQLIRNITK